MKCLLENKKVSTWLVAVIIFTAILSLDLAKSYLVFPITEGWWETYSWLDSNSGDLYKNYHVQFPPLYIKLMSLLGMWFDGSMLYMRLAMVVMHMTTIGLFMFWLRRFVDLKYAIFGVGIAAALVITNPVYLPKDYHTLVEFFTVLVLLFLRKQVKISQIVGASLCCGAMLLVKQNMGVFFGFSAVLYICSDQIEKEGYKLSSLAKSIALFAIFYALPGFIYTGIFGDSWLEVFKGNDSKGSLGTVLFRFLIDPECIKVEVSALIMSAAYYFLAYRGKYFSYHGGFFYSCTIDSGRFVRIFALVVIWLLIIASLRKGALFYAVSLSWPIARVFFYKLFGVEAKDKLIFIPLLILAYCGTQTAGYNSVSMEFLIGLMFAEVFSFTANAIAIRTKVYFEILVLSVPLLIIARNVAASDSYNWWGLSSAPLIRDHYILSKHPGFTGIFFDNFAADTFNYVLSVKDDISSNANILATPSIPLIYRILNITPSISPVLWFDVTSSKDIVDVTNYVEKYKPKYIFSLMTPAYVYDGHYKMRKKDPALFFMDESIADQVSAGNYYVDYVGFPWRSDEELKSINSPVNIYIWRDCPKIQDYCAILGNNCRQEGVNGKSMSACNIVAKNEYYARALVKANKVYVDYPGFVFYGLKRRY